MKDTACLNLVFNFHPLKLTSEYIFSVEEACTADCMIFNARLLLFTSSLQKLIGEDYLSL